MGSAINEIPAPPFYPLSDDNRSSLVVVAALIFLIYAIVSVVVKLLIRFNVASLKNHDFILIVATALYLVQTALVISACNHGLGQHRRLLSSRAYETALKFVYASQIMAIFVNGFSKLSVCLLIRLIDNTGKVNIANLALGATILVWIVVGVFTTAFQCPMPNPWLANVDQTCSSRGPIFVFNGVLNILTDIALCILPIIMMQPVQTKLEKKLVIGGLFGSRILVVIFTIPYLVTAKYLFDDTVDNTWLSVTSTIWFQIALGLSVLTATIPSLKGVIDSLMGSTAVATIGAPYELRDSRKKSQPLDPTPLPDSGSGSGSRSRSGLFSSRGKKPAYSFKGKSPQASNIWSAEREVNIKYGGNDSAEGSEGGSESVRKLTEGVIVVRDEFEIHYDDRTASLSRDGSQASVNDALPT